MLPGGASYLSFCFIRNPGLRSAIISIPVNDATKPILLVSGEVYNPNVTGPGGGTRTLTQSSRPEVSLSPERNAVPLWRFGITRVKMPHNRKLREPTYIGCNNW
jgi:hypothetical protein